MSKKQNSELIDGENPEWTDEMFKQSVRFDSLPESLREKLRKPPNGPQKAPVKVPTTILLSSDVIGGASENGK